MSVFAGESYVGLPYNLWVLFFCTSIVSERRLGGQDQRPFPMRGSSGGANLTEISW